MPGDLYTYSIEHIPELWGNRRVFETAIREASGNSAITKAAELLNLPPDQTQVDLGIYVNPGLPQKVIGGKVTFETGKEYENKRPLTEWIKTMELTKGQVRNGVIRGIDFDAVVAGFARQHITAAGNQLAECIKGGYGASGVDAVLSKIDDASSKYLFDTSAHSLNGTTDGNWRTTDPIVADTSLSDAYDYLKAAAAEWESLPDTDGQVGGAGNDFLTNGIVLTSDNIHSKVRSIRDRQTITAAYDNEYFKGFELVKVPGLPDDTLVITRDPSKGIVAGFYWCLSQGEEVDYSPPTPTHGFLTHRWTSTISWGVWPGCWIHSLLLKAS